MEGRSEGGRRKEEKEERKEDTHTHTHIPFLPDTEFSIPVGHTCSNAFESTQPDLEHPLPPLLPARLNSPQARAHWDGQDYDRSQNPLLSSTE